MNGVTRLIFSLSIIGMTALFDQLTKSLIRSQITVGEKINVISGFFDLVHLHNPGAAFGLFSGLNPTARTILFLAIYLFLGIFAVSRIRATNKRLELFAFSLLVGGAIGNAIDRFLNGHVTDFLDFYISSYHYPAFNLADVTICTAVILLVAVEYGDSQRRKS